MRTTRAAIAIQGMPRGPEGDDAEYYAVGRQYRRSINGTYQWAGTVTKITVTDDLPGLYRDMERVRVFDGDTLIFEAPLHSLEGVTYAQPNAPDTGETR